MSTSSKEVSQEILAELRATAKAACEKAYCPYSHFRVGAAVLCEDGRIFAGCNVENASYGLTICAERNAIFQAIAHGCRRVVAIVVVNPYSPLTPCGACRQVINEFGPEAAVYAFGGGSYSIKSSISELLPHSFGPEQMVDWQRI